ncbi:MAG: tRNA preQ1(34) S-adenosylmethionine ribosyltransferase-isomerase QueA [Bacillota bacterium]|nr:tRNA preQ1(34) S-adenosylmethionine ribosyltransferase-isomerase QueA [Bacillota bacterium]
MRVDSFDYFLPEGLIAQHPAPQRDASRLMVIHRTGGSIEHRRFYDVTEYLSPGDCLVLNRSKVLPARLLGTKSATGAGVEFLLLRRQEGDLWQALVRPGKKLRPGDRVEFSQAPRLIGLVEDYGPEGTRLVRMEYEGVFLETLEQVGKIPLPPYIERESRAEDGERYQTVYCREEGSVAAPTAGLHFTEELLARIRDKGVGLAFVTLHVGVGTFRPVKCESVEDHHMHFEEYELDWENAALINERRRAGGKIVAVGTTSVRTLESVAEEDGTVRACRGATDIFIYPGYRFKAVDRLITNFHLPRSTLLMLVSAFYNREAVLSAYREAVEEEYRFFSYGDAMLLL